MPMIILGVDEKLASKGILNVDPVGRLVDELQQSKQFLISALLYGQRMKALQNVANSKIAMIILQYYCLQIIMSSITSQLDSLPFSKWHMMVVIGLGMVWIFDGYQVSLVSIMSEYLIRQYSSSQYKSLATAYQLGCVLGSLTFGILSYLLGRRKITLGIYLLGVMLSLAKTSLWVLVGGRALTGISVGGQFTAIFASIDEFLPPPVRGRVNIAIDGTWHLGGALASILNLIVGETDNWRMFFIVGIIGIISLVFLRKSIPQSPRWLLMRHRNRQAQQIVKQIKLAVSSNKAFLESGQVEDEFELDDQVEKQIEEQMDLRRYTWSMVEIFRSIFVQHSKRLVLSFFLIYSQAFFFSCVYYQYPHLLSTKYLFNQRQISVYMLALSLSSFVSTIVVGPLFDSIGRKKMILATYGLSGILLLCVMGISDSVFLEVVMCLLFLFSSPASSSANLVASQIFPTNSRSMVLSMVLIVGMMGGMSGIWIDQYWVSSLLMISAGILGYMLCPNAQNKSLQEIGN